MTIVGTSITTVTDDEGNYKLSSPPGQWIVRAEFAGFVTKDTTVTVTEGSSAKVNFPLLPEKAMNETIVVVGSRTPRSNFDTPVAVDVVAEEEIARSGRTETGRILHTLAPSYNSSPQTIADGTDHIDPASLRGLGPDQVLVLVNGKRRHKTSLLHVNSTIGRGTVGTDLNAIPSSMIKRIEILRDGAASQYGSDAIAGVINIVTKDVTDIVELTAETGITGEGDGFQTKATGNYGAKLGSSGGFINITGEYFDRQPTNRAGRYTGTIYTNDGMGCPACAPDGPDPDTDPDAYLPDEQELAKRQLTRDDFEMKIGESGATAAMAAFNLELPFGDGVKFYSFGDISQRRGEAAGFYRFPKQVTQNVPAFYENGFLPEIHSEINDTAVTVGVKRKGTWNVDASLTHGRNSFQFNVENSVNASLGTLSPRSFDAGELVASQTVGNLDILRRIEKTPFKSLSFVAGSEFRSENYQIHRGDEASFSFQPPPMGEAARVPGAQVFPGFQPANEVDRTRNSIGAYLGFESEPVNRVTLDVGGRFERYSDFGNSVIGKAAARVKLLDQVAVRGAVSTGFRAPSLQQLWFSNVASLFVLDAMGVLQPNQVLTTNNASPITRAFGIPELKEERSINASGGIVLRPLENLTLTADAYFIRIEDRIALTGLFNRTNPDVAAILAPFQGITQAQFFANAIDTDTKGIDVVLDYTTPVGPGTFGFTGSANFTYTKVKDIHLPDGLNPSLSGFFFDRASENRFEDAAPLQKGTAAVRYGIKGLTTLVRGTYYGLVRYEPNVVNLAESFDPRVIFDVNVGYQITKNILLSVGADNALNTFPEKNKKPGNLFDGRFLYNRNVSQFGQNGGFYYAKLSLMVF